MKNISLVIATIMVSNMAISQTQDPDQNPNYMQSAEIYAAKKDALLASQGETIQETYVAFDWSTYKADKKQARIDNRQDVRLARAYTPNFYRGYRYNNFGNPYYGNNNFGYQYNGFNPGFGGGFLLGLGTSHFLFH